MKNWKITITGDLGSGKSAVSRLLREELGLDIHSTGSIQREMARKREMTTLELNRYAETHHDIDEMIDGFSKKLAKSSEGFILDSRMGWFFIPRSFKIYLFVQKNIAAKRIYKDTTRKDESYTSLAEARKSVLSRQKSEWSRFNKLYGVRILKAHQYDMIIDTSFVSSEEVVKVILQQLKIWSTKTEPSNKEAGEEKDVCFAFPNFMKGAAGLSGDGEAPPFFTKSSDSTQNPFETIHAFYHYFDELYEEHGEEATGNELLFTLNIPMALPGKKKEK